MNLPPDVIETLLTKSSAQILSSRSFTGADRSSLFALNRLFEAYLKTVIQRTIAFAKTNKRSKVNHDDIELSFFMESIRLGALEDELKRLHYDTSGEPDFSVLAEKVAKGFESTDRKLQSQLLGPELNGKARGIPDYMERNMVALPALPPLYTHHRSAIYVDRPLSSLEIREEVTRESTLVEQSIRRLVDIEEASALQMMKEEPMDDLESTPGPTDVMRLTVSEDEKAKRLRQQVFRDVWKEMGYGEVTQGRAVNCEIKRDFELSRSRFGENNASKT